MKKYSRIAVIGGTGKSGKYLVRELTSQNYLVNLLIRNPEKALPDGFGFDSPLIHIIYGNADNLQSVEQLFKDCDAVISALGMGIPASEKNIFTTATRNIISASAKFNIQRYIALTGLNVDSVNDQKSDFTQMATAWMRENYPVSTQDRQDEYDMLLNSKLNWTLIRLPRIIEIHDVTETSLNLADCLGNEISASSLAKAIVSQIERKEFSKKAPFLYNL